MSDTTATNIVNGTDTTKTRAPRKSSTKTAAMKAAQPKEAIMSQTINLHITVNGSLWKRVDASALDFQSNKQHFLTMTKGVHKIVNVKTGPKTYSVPLVKDGKLAVHAGMVVHTNYEFTVMEVNMTGLDNKKIQINYDGDDLTKAWEILMDAQESAREGFYTLRHALPRINYVVANKEIVLGLKRLMTRNATVLKFRAFRIWCFTDVRVKDDPYAMPESRTSGSAEPEVAAKPGK